MAAIFFSLNVKKNIFRKAAVLLAFQQLCTLRIWQEKQITFAFTNSCPLISLTICSTSVETICMQHMAVARAHTIVEMTLRAQTLKSSS